MRRRALGITLEVGVPVLVLLGWGVWSAQAGSLYFPPLTKILTSFKDTWLFSHFGSDIVPSLTRMFVGYFIAIGIAIPLGVLLGLSVWARRAADPIVEFLRAIPPPALIPFGIVVLGVGNVMKIFLIALVCVFPVLLNTISGVRSVDPTYTETSRVYGVHGAQRMRAVVLPAALPQIFAGVRTALSLAIIMMVVSEMIAASNGIGFFVLQAQRSFALPEMWSGIILLGVLGYLSNLILVIIEHYVLAWHRGAHGVTI